MSAKVTQWWLHDRWRRAVPWRLPRWVWHLTPWSWMRAYARAGDWVLFQAFWRSRPLVWWLWDASVELDRRVTARLAEKERLRELARRARDAGLG